jgi:hypothetical protein
VVNRAALGHIFSFPCHSIIALTAQQYHTGLIQSAAGIVDLVPFQSHRQIPNTKYNKKTKKKRRRRRVNWLYK